MRNISKKKILTDQTMNIGIIGLPNSGKTTVYNALTRGQEETAAYSAGRMEVPHDLGERLANVVHRDERNIVGLDFPCHHGGGCLRPGELIGLFGTVGESDFVGLRGLDRRDHLAVEVLVEPAHVPFVFLGTGHHPGGIDPG